MSRHLFQITTPAGFRYHVEEADLSHGDLGECLFTWRRGRPGLVRVAAGQKPAERLDTLVHELLHAIQPRWSERQVKRTATCLAQAIQKDGWRRQR